MEVDSPWTCQCAEFASGECAAAWQGRCASLCLGPAPPPARTPGKEQHYTPDLLHAYAAHGRVEEAQQLLASLSQQQASEECNRPNAWGMTPLHCLCLAKASPSGDIFKLLMAAGAADVHARTARSSKGSLFYEGETPLTLAAQHSRDGTAANLVSLLLSCGADPLEPAGPLYTTALEYACAAGDVEVVRAMLHHAPQSPHYRVPAYGIDASYLLSLAVAHGCTDVASLLLNPPLLLHAILTGQQLREPASVLQGTEGSDSSRPSEDGAELTAVTHIVRQTHVDVNRPIVAPLELDTCLHRAVAAGDLEMCRVLVEAGACGSHWRCQSHSLCDSLDAMDRLGWAGRFPELHEVKAPDFDDSPLTLCLKLRHLDIAEWLVKRTAAAYPHTDGKGRTALHYAVKLGSRAARLLGWLLDTGYYSIRADDGVRTIDQTDDSHFSALAYSLLAGNAAAAELLCAHGAELAHPVNTRHGCMPPMAAALTAPQSTSRCALLMLLSRFGAAVHPSYIELATKSGFAAELRVMLHIFTQAQGQHLGAMQGSKLLLDAVHADQVECAEVLLGGGVDPNFVVRESPGEEHSWSLLEYSFGLAQDALGAESETLEGCHQLPDSESLASSSGGAHGLRLVQALVLAGADPRPLLQLSQQECADSDFRAAAAQLKPSWIREQHALWPAAFKASVKTLLLVSHRLAGSAVGAASTTSLPEPVVCRIALAASDWLQEG
ncbi:hypothetical protein D9Q98_008909 [Chlorella vulgaris]|uniref:Uncharacterized protein n=1 Tax=Chlorella vulgaris TaxID=3077 RepID=A0A9D4YTB1_CHLVU|nr:hypothetical protein D9Q98_008909 [Chlorella vulgaris]